MRRKRLPLRRASTSDFIEAASKAMKVCHALAAIPIVAPNAQSKDLNTSE
jgi:hypothetical protein